MVKKDSRPLSRRNAGPSCHKSFALLIFLQRARRLQTDENPLGCLPCRSGVQATHVFPPPLCHTQTNPLRHRCNFTTSLSSWCEGGCTRWVTEMITERSVSIPPAILRSSRPDVYPHSPHRSPSLHACFSLRLSFICPGFFPLALKKRNSRAHSYS